jgi:phage terminase large subunit-like protein
VSARKHPDRTSTSSRSAAKALLDSFEAFCAELKVEDGSPFVLQEFQRTIVWDYFDGVTELVIIIPKKNGKTTLLAALALYHLLVTPNAECVMVAAAREQAEIVLRQARMFIRQSASLQRVMRVQQRSILSELDEGRIRVLASDEDTADGTIPTLAIVDELHRHKTAELYGVLRDGLTPRNGQMITISTAGATFSSPLGAIRQRAHETPGFTRKGTHNYLRQGARAFHEWCLLPGDDTSNMAVVKTANPAPWQTPEALRERFESEEETPWQFLRFACGIWTEGEEPWLDPQVWDPLGQAWAPEHGEAVWLGVHIGNIGEPGAVAVVAKREEQVLVAARILPDPDLEALEDEIRTIAAVHRVASVTYVPRQFARSAEMLEKEGFRVIEFPLTAERLGRASATLWRLIERKELRHDADKTFRAHVLAGVVKEDQQGWRLWKDPRGHRPVAALMATALAVQTAADQPSQELMMSWA